MCTSKSRASRSIPSYPTPPVRPQNWIALYDYQKTGSGDISMEYGEIVVELEGGDDDWMFIRKADGQVRPASRCRPPPHRIFMPATC